MNLDFYLNRYFAEHESKFHYFDCNDKLLTICHRYPIDAIVIGGGGDYMPELEMLRSIKQNVFLSMIPVILYHPDPDNNIVIAAFESGAEEFIHGEWVERLVKARVVAAINRNRRDLSINPSTCLPGTSIIEKEIARQLEMKAEFALCYADLDNFKAYNDYYGYVFGDKVVRLTARVIKDVVFDLCPEGFVGHIAGDDYIFIIPAERTDEICERVIKVFDTLIPYRYREDDRQRGHIVTENRRGEIEQFPILTISIAVLVNDNGKFAHLGEVSKMLADLKKAAKKKVGSNYMVERRKKY